VLTEAMAFAAGKRIHMDEVECIAEVRLCANIASRKSGGMTMTNEQ
jgi:hypothetical protein